MQLSTIKPYAGTGVQRWYNGGLLNFLLSPEQTDGQLAIIEFTIRRGNELPAHFHEHEDETFMVQEGEMTFQIGEKVVEAKPGTVVFAPRCLVHQYTIKTPTVRFVVVITPGRYAEYFWNCSTPALLPELPAVYTEHLSAKELRSLITEAERFGVVFA